jgi:hypothetical protein
MLLRQLDGPDAMDSKPAGSRSIPLSSALCMQSRLPDPLTRIGPSWSTLRSPQRMDLAGFSEAFQSFVTYEMRDRQDSSFGLVCKVGQRCELKNFIWAVIRNQPIWTFLKFPSRRGIQINTVL